MVLAGGLKFHISIFLLVRGFDGNPDRWVVAYCLLGRDFYSEWDFCELTLNDVFIWWNLVTLCKGKHDAGKVSFDGQDCWNSHTCQNTWYELYLLVLEKDLDKVAALERKEND